MKRMSDLISRSESKKALSSHDKFGYTANRELIRLDDSNIDKFVPYVKFDDVCNCIDNAPPVEIDKLILILAKRSGKRKMMLNALRPKGEWIDHRFEDLQKLGYRQCSKCKAGCQIYEHGTRKSDLPWIDGQQYTLELIHNFCPNCGADMRKESKKNDK